MVASSHDDDDDRLFFLLNAFVCGCELYLALKYSVYIDLRGRSLIVKEKERRTMRKILLTARRWDLIFDVLRVATIERPSKTIEKKENGRKKKKKNNTHTRNFYLLIIETHRSYTTT
ncbi:hypothetical protein N9D57_00035 [bacterium]|nr:hypothetical protein [bacterium]